MKTIRIRKKNASQYLFGYDNRGIIDDRFSLHTLGMNQRYYSSDVSKLADKDNFKRRKGAQYINISQVTKDEWDSNDDVFKVTLYKFGSTKKSLKASVQDFTLNRAELFEAITSTNLGGDFSFEKKDKKVSVYAKVKRMKINKGDVLLITGNLQHGVIQKLNKLLRQEFDIKHLIVMEEGMTLKSLPKDEAQRILREMVYQNEVIRSKK